jgi:hypothetical protein
VGFTNAKISYLGCWRSVQGCELPSTHAENQLPHFPQALGPILSPNPTLQAHIPTDVIQFELAEDDIGTSEIFLVRYTDDAGKSSIMPL